MAYETMWNDSFSIAGGTNAKQKSVMISDTARMRSVLRELRDNAHDEIEYTGAIDPCHQRNHFRRLPL